MSRPELDQIKRRYCEVVAQLDALDTEGVGLSQAQSDSRQDLIEEQGKIEHWLWALEPD